MQARDGAVYNSDFPNCEAKYFFVPDWTTQISLKLLGKLDFTRSGFGDSYSEGTGKPGLIRFELLQHASLD
jgi:hypothetical protein